MTYQFVSEFRDRHGTMRYRFRRAGVSAYLPSPDAPAFFSEYSKLLETVAPAIRSPKSPVGKLRAILRERGWGCQGDFIYFIQMKGMVKIGYSSRIVERITELTARSPTPIRLLTIMRGDRSVERKLHETLCADRIKGEWFRRSQNVKRMIAFAKNGGTYVYVV